VERDPYWRAPGALAVFREVLASEPLGSLRRQVWLLVFPPRNTLAAEHEALDVSRESLCHAGIECLALGRVEPVEAYTHKAGLGLHVSESPRQPAGPVEEANADAPGPGSRIIFVRAVLEEVVARGLVREPVPHDHNPCFECPPECAIDEFLFVDRLALTEIEQQG